MFDSLNIKQTTVVVCKQANNYCRLLDVQDLNLFFTGFLCVLTQLLQGQLSDHFRLPDIEVFHVLLFFAAA